MKKFIISFFCITFFLPIFGQIKFQPENYYLAKNGILMKSKTSFQIPVTLSSHPKSITLKYLPGLQMDDIDVQYNMYQKKYENARTLSTVGAVISVTGFSLFAAALGILLLEAVNSDDHHVNTDPPVKMMVASYFFITFGIPIWISQYTKAKNNQRAMEKLKPLKLGLGVTENGAGLVMSF